MTSSPLARDLNLVPSRIALRYTRTRTSKAQPYKCLVYNAMSGGSVSDHDMLPHDQNEDVFAAVQSESPRLGHNWLD